MNVAIFHNWLNIVKGKDTNLAIKTLCVLCGGELSCTFVFNYLTTN